MSKQLIAANPSGQPYLKPMDDGKTYLEVAECFYDAIQGEGIYTGHPAVFLRLKGCVFNCIWCDSKEVWRNGNPYSVDELLTLMQTRGVVERLRQGHHLVITGGSPLKQQKGLIVFIERFKMRYGFKPFIEVENECVIEPTPVFTYHVDCWNNSPKLDNSGVSKKARYKPALLKFMSTLSNSWFKFVIFEKRDWLEIEDLYLQEGLIKRNQIILMPEGITKTEIEVKQKEVVNLAINQHVKYSGRMHISIWNKRVGI